MSPVDVVHDLVNQARIAEGLSGLNQNPLLELVAQDHADDMARHGYYSHTDRMGGSVVERVEASGYFARAIQWSVAENIALGFRTPAAVFEGWMNSSGHRKNILDPKTKEIGIGYQMSEDGTYYWVQVFGSRVVG